MTAVATTARDRARLIREGLAAVWDLLTAAYAAEDWKTLGYSSWEAYCIGEFQGRIPRLAKSERGGVVQELADHGMPIKAIAAATGIARNTVRKDLRTDEEQPEGGQFDPPAQPAKGRQQTRDEWAEAIKDSLRRAFGPLMESVDKIRENREHLAWARDNHPEQEVRDGAAYALRLVLHDDGTPISDAEHYEALIYLAEHAPVWTADHWESEEPQDVYYAYLRGNRPTT